MLGLLSGCCWCLSDWFCLSCLSIKKSSMWWHQWLVNSSYTHTLCMQYASACFGSGAHNYACLCFNERWLAWYVLCVFECVRGCVCMRWFVLGGRWECECVGVSATWALLCTACIWMSTHTACLDGMLRVYSKLEFSKHECSPKLKLMRAVPQLYLSKAKSTFSDGSITGGPLS